MMAVLQPLVEPVQARVGRLVARTGCGLHSGALNHVMDMADVVPDLLHSVTGCAVFCVIQRTCLRATDNNDNSLLF